MGALVACSDDPETFVFEAVVVDADGGNPVAGTDATSLTIAIQEGERPVETLESPITDGSFNALLAFQSFFDPTRLRVALEGPTTTLLTAPPEFVPSLTAGSMRVVATTPSTCATVGFNEMEAPREAFGMVQSDTFALLVGGTGPSEEQVEFLDALEWASRLFPEEFALSSLGPTRAASIDEDQILVLSENASPFVFNMDDPDNRVTTVVLHPGAGARSGLVSVPERGAIVVGGELSGQPQDGASLVTPDGTITSLRLSEPRSGPAVAALGTDVLVVGGEPIGTAELFIDGSSTGEPVASLGDGVRLSGILASDTQSRALLLGGTDGNGTVRGDTVRFDGCPDACAATPGPVWGTARLEVLQPAQSALLVGGTGSRLVEEVQWMSDEVAIAPVLELDFPRASPGGIVLESGAFIVGGGSDGVSVRGDFEFCVPSELEPL